MITLTYGATTVDLPADLLWSDEFTWSSIEQRSEYTITGALVVEAGLKQAGQSITLSGDATRAWIPRGTLLTLLAWAKLPAQSFTLAIRGESYTVLWDQQRTAIQAERVHVLDDDDPADDYVATLRFVAVG